MKTSTTTKEISAALCIVQAELEPARFNAINPYFKSKYADLGSVFEACRHLLAENGLSFVQFPSTAPIEYGAAVSLTSRLMHESGEWLEDTMTIPLAKATAQDYGSALTYARRYALSAIVGIVAEEDDDGNQAQPEPRGRNVIKNPPRTKVKKNATVADVRSSLDELSNFTLGIVADRAAMTGKYKNKNHALEAMKEYTFPEGVGIKFSQKVSKDGAIKVFDWLIGRKS